MMSVRASTTITPGDRPAGAVGMRPAQPKVWEPLQAAPLMTETVPGVSPRVLFVTYTVWVWSLTATPRGTSPTWTVAARCPQPEWLVPLQVAPLITATVWPLKVGAPVPRAEAASV